jgi:hypothetical protein
MSFLSEQVKAAAVRGLIIAVPTALLTFLTTWSTTGDAKTLVIATGTSFIGTFLARSGLEGLYDQNRAKNGDVHSSDVGASQPPAEMTPAPASG